MSEGGIRDFLTVPGIAGLAVFGSQATPFFSGSAFTTVHTEPLSQGILQVVETIPESFERFEFRFAEFWVQLHRIETHTSDTIALLIVTQDRLRVDHPLLAQLKQQMATDPQSTIAELAAGAAAVSPAPPSLADFLAAFSALRDYSRRYLGMPVIVNYLKSCRPESVQQIQVERSADFIVLGEPSALEAPLTPEDHRLLRDWSQAYIRRCSHVVRNFATLVEQEALTVNQKTLLFGE